MPSIRCNDWLILFLKFLEKIMIIALAIIFAIPYFIYRYFKPKKAKTEEPQKTTKQVTAAFTTLEIAPTSNMDIIKSAYRNLAKNITPTVMVIRRYL